LNSGQTNHSNSYSKDFERKLQRVEDYQQFAGKDGLYQRVNCDVSQRKKPSADTNVVNETTENRDPAGFD
jgi:hypothetical protein